MSKLALVLFQSIWYWYRIRILKPNCLACLCGFFLINLLIDWLLPYQYPISKHLFLYLSKCFNGFVSKPSSTEWNNNNNEEDNQMRRKNNHNNNNNNHNNSTQTYWSAMKSPDMKMQTHADRQVDIAESKANVNG